jgi:hypothetical protein
MAMAAVLLLLGRRRWACKAALPLAQCCALGLHGLPE